MPCLLLFAVLFSGVDTPLQHFRWPLEIENTWFW